jgi:hypothetical protein
LTFEGGVWKDGFRIRRTINYRNQFRPVFHGRIEPAPEGSRVHLRATPTLPATVFLCVSFSFDVAMLIVGLVRLARAGDPSFALFMLGFTLLGYLITMSGFWYDARKSKKVVREMLQA